MVYSFHAAWMQIHGLSCTPCLDAGIRSPPCLDAGIRPPRYQSEDIRSSLSTQHSPPCLCPCMSWCKHTVSTLPGCRHTVFSFSTLHVYVRLCPSLGAGIWSPFSQAAGRFTICTLSEALGAGTRFGCKDTVWVLTYGLGVSVLSPP